jgi:hypothetical protein
LKVKNEKCSKKVAKNALIRQKPGLERFKKNCGRSERGILGFGRGFDEGACLQTPETEEKRRTNPKAPLTLYLFRMATVFLKPL